MAGQRDQGANSGTTFAVANATGTRVGQVVQDKAGATFYLSPAATGGGALYLVKGDAGTVMVTTVNNIFQSRDAAGSLVVYRWQGRNIDLYTGIGPGADGPWLTTNTAGTFADTAVQDKSGAIFYMSSDFGVYQVRPGGGTVRQTTASALRVFADRLGRPTAAILQSGKWYFYMGGPVVPGAFVPAPTVSLQCTTLATLAESTFGGGATFAKPISAPSLIITGGADLAEPFRVQGTKVLPGSLVSVDPDRPGDLRVASGPYDASVAGIISGAQGLDAGVTLRAPSIETPGKRWPVALAGRVYCLADASFGEIRPGDLLTTSSTPGHAMKVTDRSRAQGATVGKSLGSLPSGRGYVLVLVTLR